MVDACCFLISIPLVWEMFQKDGWAGMRTFRVLVVIAAIVCLSGIAYITEHFTRSELISQLGLANERLRLAVEAGRSVAWEWNLKTGQNSWFGDLENMFGIPVDTFIGQDEDFYRYVHPEDRQMVAKANAAARQSRMPYAAEFRVVRLDGTVSGPPPPDNTITQAMAILIACWALQWTSPRASWRTKHCTRARRNSAYP